MEYTSAEERVSKTEERHFNGFALDDVKAGLQILADAVPSDGGQVVNSTSEGILKGLADGRPFFIQNHGSLEKALAVWKGE